MGISSTQARTLTVGLWCLVLAAPSAHADAGDPVTTRRIGWQGVEALGEKELERRILTTARSWKPWVEPIAFDEGTLIEDVARLRIHYQTRGYYETLIRYTLEWSDDRSQVDVHFVVEEGPPVLLRWLEIDLVEHGDADHARKDRALLFGLPLVFDEVFQLEDYKAAKTAIRERFADIGHPAATLDGGAQVDLATHSVSVNWTVDPGPEVTLGSVTIRGLAGVERELVERELLFDEGERFSGSRLRASERAIYDLGLFRRVAIRSTAPADGGAWPVEVHVRERDRRSVQVGVGYGTEDNFRARLTWLHRNFFGGARLLNLTGKYSSLVTGFGSSLSQPWFFHRDTELDIGFSVARDTPPAYESLNLRFGPEIFHELTPLWTLRAGYQIEWADVKNVTAGSALDEGEALLSFLSFGVRRSSVDDRINPTTGSHFDFAIEPSLTGIGSDVDYVKMTIEGRWYYPLPWHIVLALRGKVGMNQTFSDSERDDVPVFQRFYSGGANSVRGFAFQKLGPADALGEPEGGLSLAEATVELRFPIWRMLAGAVFADVGQVQRDPWFLTAEDFRASLGVGLRLRTPVGDLRLDYGRILNPPPEISDHQQFHFSLGQAF